MAAHQSSAPALEIRDLEAWYGESHVLHGVDIVVQPGEPFEIEGLAVGLIRNTMLM